MVAASIEGPVGTGLLHGLKIVAVAVVAQAVWGMAKSLAPDRQRASIALVGIICVVFVAGAFGQILALALGAIAGLCFCRSEAARQASHLAFRVPKSVGYIALATFALLLAFLPVFAAMAGSQGLSLFDAFYRAGALVFGGGHVVLPLLQSAVVSTGWVTEDAFIAGYGATQAVPGPLFTFAAYLGAVVGPQPNGVAGAVIALVAIFLPGMLLLVGALPFWEGFRKHLLAQAAMRGANAAVVGILGAALYDPVWTSAIFMPKDFALALTGFILLTVWKTPPWIVVVICAIGGVLLALS
jgi:chromate transporter